MSNYQRKRTSIGFMNKNNTNECAALNRILDIRKISSISFIALFFIIAVNKLFEKSPARFCLTFQGLSLLYEEAFFRFNFVHKLYENSDEVIPPCRFLTFG